MRSIRRGSALAAAAVILMGIVPIVLPATMAGATSNTSVFWAAETDDGHCPENNTVTCDLEIDVTTWADSYDSPSTLAIVETNGCIDDYTWSQNDAYPHDNGTNWILETYVTVPVDGYQCAEGTSAWRVTYDASTTP
jgi:hypothetical protein